jgi:hypothetical protein
MGSWDAMNTRQSNIMQRAGPETLFTTPPPTPRRTPQQVMQSVVDELPYPETFIAVNPAPAKQVVGVPTWVWLTGKDGTVSPGAAGEEQTCTGAGVPESDISGLTKTATKGAGRPRDPSIGALTWLSQQGRRQPRAQSRIRCTPISLRC